MLVYALYALLLYPDGHYLQMKIGDDLSGPRCEAAQTQAESQLAEDLSIAKLVATACQKSYRI